MEDPIDPIERARQFVQERRPRKMFAVKDIDWSTLVAIAHQLRSAPIITDSHGLARLMTWLAIAEYIQTEFPSLAKIKPSSLAAAVCARYHRTYPNKRTCIRIPRAHSLPSTKPRQTTAKPSQATSKSPTRSRSKAGCLKPTASSQPASSASSSDSSSPPSGAGSSRSSSTSRSRSRI